MRLIIVWLHWLDVPQRIQFKLGVTVRTAGQCSLVPCRLLQVYTTDVRPTGRQRLRSASRHQFNVQPGHRRTKFSRRVFSVAGPTACKSLPDYLRDPSLSEDTSRRSLKTHWFASYLEHVAHQRHRVMRSINVLLTYLLTYFDLYVTYQWKPFFSISEACKAGFYITVTLYILWKRLTFNQLISSTNDICLKLSKIYPFKLTGRLFFFHASLVIALRQMSTVFVYRVHRFDISSHRIPACEARTTSICSLIGNLMQCMFRSSAIFRALRTTKSAYDFSWRTWHISLRKKAACKRNGRLYYWPILCYHCQVAAFRLVVRHPPCSAARELKLTNFQYSVNG